MSRATCSAVQNRAHACQALTYCHVCTVSQRLDKAKKHPQLVMFDGFLVSCLVLIVLIVLAVRRRCSAGPRLHHAASHGALRDVKAILNCLLSCCQYRRAQCTGMCYGSLCSLQRMKLLTASPVANRNGRAASALEVNRFGTCHRAAAWLAAVSRTLFRNIFRHQHFSKFAWAMQSRYIVGPSLII